MTGMEEGKYAIVTTTYFYDSSGTPDKGGTKVEVYQVQELKKFKDLEFNTLYHDEEETYVKRTPEELDEYAADGYNCEQDFIKVIPISTQDYHELKRGLSILKRVTKR